MAYLYRDPDTGREEVRHGGMAAGSFLPSSENRPRGILGQNEPIMMGKDPSTWSPNSGWKPTQYLMQNEKNEKEEEERARKEIEENLRGLSDEDIVSRGPMIGMDARGRVSPFTRLWNEAYRAAQTRLENKSGGWSPVTSGVISSENKPQMFEMLSGKEHGIGEKAQTGPDNIFYDAAQSPVFKDMFTSANKSNPSAGIVARKEPAGHGQFLPINPGEENIFIDESIHPPLTAAATGTAMLRSDEDKRVAAQRPISTSSLVPQDNGGQITGEPKYEISDTAAMLTPEDNKRKLPQKGGDMYRW